MLKSEFLKQLENRLLGIPKEDLNRTIDYYNEIISDKQEDGMSEEEAINSLGSIDEIVKDILNEIPIKKLVKEKLQLNRKLKTWEIVLDTVYENVIANDTEYVTDAGYILTGAIGDVPDSFEGEFNVKVYTVDFEGNESEYIG